MKLTLKPLDQQTQLRRQQHLPRRTTPARDESHRVTQPPSYFAKCAQSSQAGRFRGRGEQVPSAVVTLETRNDFLCH